MKKTKPPGPFCDAQIKQASEKLEKMFEELYFRS